MTAASPGVLMVTGAYYPQISASAVQCRAIARALAGRVRFRVLATATDPTLPSRELVDGVPVHRVVVATQRRQSIGPVVAFASQYFHAAADVDLVHVHGVSQKNVIVAVLAAWTRKPLVLTLHTAGQDEPEVIRRRGRAAWWSFRRAARVVSVSARLTERYLAAGLPRDRLFEIPNGIDLERFRPATAVEREALKRDLGFGGDRPLILFVGFFSRDKRPDLLFDAWTRLLVTRRAALAFVGATGPSYGEIDPGLIEALRERAIQMGIAAHVQFIDPTHEIEKYYRAADCYVLSSRREAMPLALLEAMACGLPSIATRLAGVTDRIITDREDGLLFDGDDRALAAALETVLGGPQWAAAVGAAARQTIVDRYGIDQVAEQWVALYRSVLT